MRLCTRIAALLFAAVPLWAGPGEPPSESKGLSCLVDLELPRFAVANMVPEGGHVDARILLGADGRPATFTFDSTNPILSHEVEYHLRDTATYRSDCGGQEIKLEFTFKVDARRGQCPWAKTQFLPPNHFIITTQLPESTPDITPLKPRQTKKGP
jgi:hypothetical protein